MRCDINRNVVMIFQSCAGELETRILPMEQRTGNHILGGLLYHTIRLLLVGTCYTVRIWRNSAAISTADSRFLQRFIRHAGTSIQGTLLSTFNVPFP